VKNCADIGPAVIVSESSIGSGLRRIDMVVGEAADDLVRKDRELLQGLARSFNVPVEQLPDRIAALRAEVQSSERERQKLREEVRTAKVRGGNGLPVRHGQVDYIAETVDASTVDELAAYADRYLEMLKSGIVTVVAGDKFVIKVSKDLTAQYDANRLGRLIGTGGGPAHLSRGKLSDGVSPDEAFKRLEEALK
jgi:alanyl-tRNA synthetase